MDDGSMRAYGEQLLALYPGELVGEVKESLEELAGHVAVLASEVAAAEEAGVSFADAVRRDAEFPMMARVHAGAIDLLQLELRADERQAVEAAVAHAATPGLDEARRRWFLAAADGGALEAPLMRFLLFQAVRLNVWVATWADGAVLEASGTLRDLDEAAERDLRDRLAMIDMRDPAVRPLQVLVAEALQRTELLWQARRAELAAATRTQHELFEAVRAAAAVARELGAGDAALVRNEIAGVVDGEQLGSRELAERSPLALPSQNGTDQRRRRLLARLRDGDPPEPNGPRVIDIVR